MGIQPKMRDPDPDSMNTDLKRCRKAHMKYLQPKFGKKEPEQILHLDQHQNDANSKKAKLLVACKLDNQNLSRSVRPALLVFICSLLAQVEAPHFSSTCQ
jgi:hypothetical protein